MIAPLLIRTKMMMMAVLVCLYDVLGLRCALYTDYLNLTNKPMKSFLLLSFTYEGTETQKG